MKDTAVKVRILESCFEAIKNDFRQHAPNESLAFLLAKKSEKNGKLLYIVTKAITLDDEITRKRYSADVSLEFSKAFYASLKKNRFFEEGYRVITVHSHPFCKGNVKMSGIDDAGMRYDEEAYLKSFGENIEFLTIVFNADMTSFDGYVVWSGKREAIDEVAIVGNGLNKMRLNQDIIGSKPETLSRTLLIPGFDYEKLSNLKIGVVGTGGLGSCMVIALVLEGFSENSQMVLVEDDKFDASNLGRIALASFEDIGREKVLVAKDFIHWLRPERSVVAVAEKCFSQSAQEELMDCDLIISCVDSELARLAINQFVNNFLIPLMDIGSAVTVDEIMGQKFAAQAGQVRLYVPGSTPCLLCNMGIDSQWLNNELGKMFMNEQEKKFLGKTGYLQNLINADLPQPSVYSLNSSVVAVAMSVLKKYLLEEKINYDWHHVNFGEATILKSKRQSNENCPVCGKHSIPGEGRFFDVNALRVDRTNLPLPSFESNKTLKSDDQDSSSADEITGRKVNRKCSLAIVRRLFAKVKKLLNTRIL